MKKKKFYFRVRKPQFGVFVENFELGAGVFRRRPFLSNFLEEFNENYELNSKAAQIKLCNRSFLGVGILGISEEILGKFLSNLGKFYAKIIEIMYKLLSNFINNSL